jgi:hypothetical protein
MDSRRLVVWIWAGILGFQGATLVLDLLNCTLLSWLWVRQHGIERQAAPQHQDPPPVGRAGQTDGGRAGQRPPDGVGQAEASEAISASHSPPVPLDPTAVFCDGPHSRINPAVGQGLSILAWLALGGSVKSGAGSP